MCARGEGKRCARVFERALERGAGDSRGKTERADNCPAVVNRAARASDPPRRERVAPRRDTVGAHLTHFAGESRRFLIPRATPTLPRMLCASAGASVTANRKFGRKFTNFPARSKEREREREKGKEEKPSNEEDRAAHRSVLQSSGSRVRVD